jgi:hypothetical protein
MFLLKVLMDALTKLLLYDDTVYTATQEYNLRFCKITMTMDSQLLKNNTPTTRSGL